MQTVIVSPRDKRVGILSEDLRQVNVCLPASEQCRTIPIEVYFSRFPDSTVVETEDGLDLAQLLREQSECAYALDFTLLLFDRQILDETKREIAIALDRMLNKQTIRTYVLDILLSKPLASVLSRDRVLATAIGLPHVDELLTLIMDAQTRVQAAADAWSVTRLHPLVRSAGERNVLGAIISAGIFRKMISSGRLQVDRTNIQRELAIEGSQTHPCDPQILNALVSEYLAILPAVAADSEVTGALAPGTIENVSSYGSLDGHRAANRPDSRHKATTLLSTIKRRFSTDRSRSTMLLIMAAFACAGLGFVAPIGMRFFVATLGVHETLCITGLAFLLAVVVTPSIRGLAHLCGLEDLPDRRRKLRRQPIALGGGVAVLFSVIASVAIVLNAFPVLNQIVCGTHISFSIGLLLSSSLIVIVGLVDDRYGLRGRQKLLGQMVAAFVLVMSGLVVRNVEVFGWKFELGLLSIPFTLLWLVGAINALNLIDGLDGLAGAVGVVLSLAIAAIAYMTVHEAESLIAMALCGALLGFLVYNLPPASIYLGDAGTMLIGLLLGTLAMRSSFIGPATVTLLAPTVIWSIPILDVGMAVLRRKLTGRSIYETDRGHLHHCLLRLGLSGYSTLIYIALFCTVTSVGVLISVARQNEWVAVISAFAVFSTLIVTRSFGYVECLMLGSRIRSLASSMISSKKQSNEMPLSLIRAPMTGTRDWEELWDSLTDYANRFDLLSIQLNVNLPALNEEYHVNWNRRNSASGQQWTTEIPLIVGKSTVGRLKFSGLASDGDFSAWMGELIEGLKPFESQLKFLLAHEVETRTKVSANENWTEPDESLTRAQDLLVKSR